VISGVRRRYDRWEYLPQKRAALVKWTGRLAALLAMRDEEGAVAMRGSVASQD
jgi:hypothetical protein